MHVETGREILEAGFLSHLLDKYVLKTTFGRERPFESDGETRFHWNAQGLLARVQLPNGDEWTYRYDALARRVEKRGPKVVSIFTRADLSQNEL